MKPARLSEREYALDPAVSPVAFGTLASLAPEYSKAHHPLTKLLASPTASSVSKSSLGRTFERRRIYLVTHVCQPVYKVRHELF